MKIRRKYSLMLSSLNRNPKRRKNNQLRLLNPKKTLLNQLSHRIYHKLSPCLIPISFCMKLKTHRSKMTPQIQFNRHQRNLQSSRKSQKTNNMNKKLRFNNLKKKQKTKNNFFPKDRRQNLKALRKKKKKLSEKSFLIAYKLLKSTRKLLMNHK